MTDPGLIGIAGDWHGNIRAAETAIRQICGRLHEESPKIILQAGDFGLYPFEQFTHFAGKAYVNENYLEKLQQLLEDNDAELWFIDGNHEDHDLLEKRRKDYGPDEMASITPDIWHLPRGYRWTWHGKTWLALGGAVSVDKAARKEGADWFPQEEITDAQEALASTGPADVLLSHDCPASEPLSLPPPPDFWLPMIPRAEAHRDRLERVCRAVKPSQVFHGHYHLSQERTMMAPWGPCRFTALNRDGETGNWGILDTATMDWEWQ